MAKVSSFQRKISKIKVGLSSPERILSWSNGEVKKPETKTNVSPLQVANICMIVNAQGRALVAWDKEMVKTFIDNIDKEIT